MASNDSSGDAVAPDSPTDLPERSWKAILKRTVKEFQDDNLTDWAAALTYYGVMSLFPMLVAIGPEMISATTTSAAMRTRISVTSSCSGRRR